MIKKKLVIPLLAVAMLAGGAIGFAGMVSAQTVTTTSAATTSTAPPQGGPGRQGGDPGIHGTVTSITGTDITLTEESRDSSTTTTFSVDASGAVVMKDGASSTLSAIAVGDKIGVQGTVSGTSVTATTIEDGRPNGAGGKGPGGDRGGKGGPGGAGGPHVEGYVSAINGNTITLTETIDASGATITKDGVSSTLSNIAVGDKIMADGTANGSSLTATHIMDGKPTTTK